MQEKINLELLGQRVRSIVHTIPCGQLIIKEGVNGFEVFSNQFPEALLVTKHEPIARLIVESPQLLIDLLQSLYLINEDLQGDPPIS